VKINRDVERSADALDQANEAGELFLEAALAKQKDALAPETHPDFDGAHCVECNADMPKARLDLKRIRCIGCQTALEKQRNQFKR
jgi:RNA polymerase-binding transcription factor DksA